MIMEIGITDVVVRIPAPPPHIAADPATLDTNRGNQQEVLDSRLCFDCSESSGIRQLQPNPLNQCWTGLLLMTGAKDVWGAEPTGRTLRHRASGRAEPVATIGQFCWPRPGSCMAATGARDLHEDRVQPPCPRRKRLDRRQHVLMGSDHD